MLPPVMPVMFSISTGVMTCLPMMARRMFGAYRSMVAMTDSPKASRLESSRPPSISYGAYCTKHDITCLPGGAISGSIIEGKIMSTYGCFAKRSYFASS